MNIIGDFLSYFSSFVISIYKDRDKELYSLLNDKYDLLISSDLVTQSEKDYILSQYIKVHSITVYTLPIIKMSYERMRQRYNTFYNLEDFMSDVLITDLNYIILNNISEKLFNKLYLSEEKEVSHNIDISGVRYGLQSRLLFMLTISRRGLNRSKYNCIFLLDTGSKSNYISDQVLSVLGIENINSNIKLVVEGIETNFYSCILDKRLEDINLLGDDFLRDSKSVLTIDYSDEDNFSSRLLIT